MFSGLALALGLLVLELTQVCDAADRRVGLGRHLDQVQPTVVCLDQSLPGRHDSELISLLIDHANLAGTNLMVYTDKTLNR